MFNFPPKFPPTDRTDIILLGVLAGFSVGALLLSGAVAVRNHGLDTLEVISASCCGIGLLIALYGLVWGRQHANVLYRLALLALGVGSLVIWFRQVVP